AYSHRPSSVTARLVTLRLPRPWWNGSQLAPPSWLTRTPRPPLTTPTSSKNSVVAANTRPPPGANWMSLIHSGRSVWSARSRVTPPSSLVYSARPPTTSRSGSAGSTAMAVTWTSETCSKVLPPSVDTCSPSRSPAQIRSGSVGSPATASKIRPCARLRQVAPPSLLSTNPASVDASYPTSTRSGSAGWTSSERGAPLGSALRSHVLPPSSLR